MAAKKEHVDVVLPTTGEGVEYEVISRQVTENAHRNWSDIKSDPYDEIVEQRKKKSYGNPEEVFETYETVRYRRYHPAPDPVAPVAVEEIKAPIDNKVKVKPKTVEVES